MKICIATFYNIRHPGAVLQAYALCRKLNWMGHDARLIRYPERRETDQPRLLSAEGLYGAWTRSAGKTRGYARFIEKHCPETSRGYSTASELRIHPPEADAYVCGSDQIWNPSLTGGNPDPAYFLDFGGNHTKRIAYAASYGGGSLSAADKASMVKWLRRFDAVSVREKEGIGLVRELTGNDAVLVQDPTLLVDGWEGIAEPVGQDGAYVLLYQLQKSERVYTAARSVAKQLGKPLWNIDASARFWTRPGKCVRPLSPTQWLGLFKGAAAIVTNSFHGTVFSVLFQRPFLTVSLSGGKASRSGRMQNLCENLGLSQNYVSNDAVSPQYHCVEPDWDEASARLGRLREASVAYLEQALSG